MILSPNFTLAEMTLSQEAVRAGLKNKPDALQTEALQLLCETVLQPLRDRIKRPIVVSSGFRSTTVNRRIGGSTKSQHCRGEAADITVPGMTTKEIVELIRAMALPIDQLIDEFGSWVHVSHSRPGPQRGQVLKVRRIGGRVVYSPL